MASFGEAQIIRSMNCEKEWCDPRVGLLWLSRVFDRNRITLFRCRLLDLRTNEFARTVVALVLDVIVGRHGRKHQKRSVAELLCPAKYDFGAPVVTFSGPSVSTSSDTYAKIAAARLTGTNAQRI